MYDSMRDSIGVALKYLGYSLNTRNEAEVAEARDLLIQQRSIVKAYLGDTIKDAMIGGEALWYIQATRYGALTQRRATLI